MGAHQGLSPVLDICRDPRWGRTEETFGEDPAPRRPDGGRVRQRPAGRRPRRRGDRHRQALRRLRRVGGRAELGAVAPRRPRAARRLPASVRGGGAIGRVALGDERLQRARRRPGGRRPRTAHRHPARAVGIRRLRRGRLLRRPPARRLPPSRRRCRGGGGDGARRRARRRAARNRLLRRAAAAGGPLRPSRRGDRRHRRAAGADHEVRARAVRAADRRPRRQSPP